MALKAKDKKVIKAFADQKAASGVSLDTDGKTLETMGMGAMKFAWWKGYKVHVAPGVPHVKWHESILRMLRKEIPKNSLKEDTMDTTAKLKNLLSDLRSDDTGDTDLDEAKAMGLDSDQEIMFDEVLMMAQNEGRFYAKRDAKGAVAYSLKEYLKIKAQAMREDARVIEKHLVKELAAGWRRK